MKKFFFALPIVALCLLATFCTKEKTAPIEPTTNVSGSVSDRDKDPESCSITVVVPAGVSFCGLAANNTPCLNCLNEQLLGVENGPGTFTYNVNVQFPSLPFSIRNNTGTKATIQIGTNAFPLSSWSIDAGQCLQFALSTTCLLFATEGPN